MERELLLHEIIRLGDFTNAKIDFEYPKKRSVIKYDGPITIRYTDNDPEVEFVKKTSIGFELINRLNPNDDFVGEYIKRAAEKIVERINLEFDADNAALQNVTEAIKDIKDVKEINFNIYDAALKSAVLQAIKEIHPFIKRSVNVVIDAYKQKKRKRCKKK